MIKTGALSTLLLLALAAAPTVRAGEPAELNCTPYTDPLDPALDLELCQGAWLNDKDGLPIINMRDGDEYRWIVGQVTNNNAKMGACKLSFDIAGTEKSHGFLMDPTSLPVGGKLGQLAPGELMTFSFLIPANDNGAVIVKLAKGLKSCIVDKKPVQEEEEDEEPVDTYVPKEVPQAEQDYEEGGTDQDLPDPAADDGVEEREGGVLDTTPAVNTKDISLMIVENNDRALKVKTSGKVPGMKRRPSDDDDEEEEEEEEEEEDDDEDEDEEAEEDEDEDAEEEEEEETTPVKNPTTAATKKPAAAKPAPATQEAADAAAPAPAEPAAAEPAPVAAPEAVATPAARALRGMR